MRIVFGDKLPESFYMRWLTHLRPLSELRIGGFSIKEILINEGFSIYYNYNDPELERYYSQRFKVNSSEKIKGDYIYLNSGLIGPYQRILSLINNLYNYASEKITIYYLNNDIVGIYIPSGKPNDVDIDVESARKIKLNFGELYIIRYPWEIPSFNTYVLKSSSSYLIDKLKLEKYTEGVYIKGGADVSYRTHFITNDGPVFLYNVKEIWGYSIVKGPSLIRENTYLIGGRIIESIIGPTCKIGGEVADSLINGFSNMQHHGYVGHSYIGEWVNIGAGTVFSDLKNTYGEVRVDWMGQKINTGSIKVGSFIADHVKIAINSSIYAGKFIGVFSHVYGLVYKNIPPFTIWNGYTRKLYELDPRKAVEIMERTYSRRNVNLVKGEKKLIYNLFEATRIYRSKESISKEAFNI